MNITDTHCDTIIPIADEGKSIIHNDLHIALDRMNPNNHYTQFFACFIAPEYISCAAERCMQLIGAIKNAAEVSAISVCRSGNDLDRARKDGNTAAFISIEGGECITSLTMLRTYYELGVRLASLTWNSPNHLASGAHDASGRGLTVFGKAVVREMNRLGMLIDVSHLNEASFFDVVRESSAPVIASHSCSKKICPHVRNLTDEQFKIICGCGGYVGINFYPPFLRTDYENASVEDITAHILHFLELGGEDTIGLGSDFDGTDGLLPRGISGIESLEKVAAALKSAGLSDRQTEKIMSGNAERIIRML